MRGDKSGTLSEFWRMTAGFRGFRSPPLGDGHGRQSNAGPPGLGRGEFLALAARVIAPVSALNIALVVALLTAPFTAPSSRW